MCWKQTQSIFWQLLYIPGLGLWLPSHATWLPSHPFSHKVTSLSNKRTHKMSFLNEQKYLSHLSYWFKLDISHVYGAGEFSHLQQMPPNIWWTLPPVRFYGIHFWNGSDLAFLIRQSDPSLMDWQTLKHKWCLTILAFTKFSHMVPVTLFYLSIYLFSFCALFHLCVRDIVKHEVTGLYQWYGGRNYFWHCNRYRCVEQTIMETVHLP